MNEICIQIFLCVDMNFKILYLTKYSSRNECQNKNTLDANIDAFILSRAYVTFITHLSLIFGTFFFFWVGGGEALEPIQTKKQTLLSYKSSNSRPCSTSFGSIVLLTMAASTKLA